MKMYGRLAQALHLVNIQKMLLFVPPPSDGVWTLERGGCQPVPAGSLVSQLSRRADRAQGAGAGSSETSGSHSARLHLGI